MHGAIAGGAPVARGVRGQRLGLTVRPRSQVSSRYSQSSTELPATAVEPAGELLELTVQRGDLLRVVGDRPVDRDRRAVVGLEVVAELGRRRRSWSTSSVCLRGRDVGDPVAEQRADVVLVAPQRRRLRAGRRRRRVRLHGGEHLPDEALRRPAEQADGAARAADPDQLVGAGWWCGANMTPTQEITASNVAVGERQRLGVAPARQSSSTPRSAAACAAGVEQLGRQVAWRRPSAPAAAAGMAALPEPAATSSTRSPGPTPLASTRTGPRSPTMIAAPRRGSRRAPTSRGAWP